MNMPVNAKDFSLVDAKEHTLTHRSIDAANYIGPIDMDTMMASYEEAFERFVFKNGEKVSFEDFIAHGENLDTIVMTAHPTFFKSKEEAGLLSELFTARAEGKTDQVEKLEAQVKDIQTKHPYQDPTTDEEGERLYDALKNTIAPGQMMQRAMLNVAKKHYQDDWENGHYSPFNRAIWQKFDLDGRDIPVNVKLGESLRQRRMGLELVYLPQFRALQDQDLSGDQTEEIEKAITRIGKTCRIYEEKEKVLAALDENDIDMDALQIIINELKQSKKERITHPEALTSALNSILKKADIDDEVFIAAKLINDDLQSNGLCFATPTHRVNADDVHSYLEVERRRIGKGDLRKQGTIDADDAHFDSTEEMIESATDQTTGKTFTQMLRQTPADGKPVHEMMIIRGFVHDALDSHTIEKVDIAEAHNAMTQRGLRLATKQHGISEITDIGLLHEDNLGIDAAPEIYRKLLKSKQFLNEISHTVPGTNKKRPRIVMKIGYSDFAKQHSSPGGKPYNEKCLLQTIKAIRDAGLAGKVDLDVEFAGGEGPGRRVNPKGYEWTLKETITPAILSYAAKNGVTLKYRETIQGGDGCILLGTEQSAAKVMATQIDHISKHITRPPEKTWDKQYYNVLRGKVKEHTKTARDAYFALYNNHDFALLMKLDKKMCERGGSRKVIRAELSSPYERDKEDKAPLADFRAIGFNAASINTGVPLPAIFGQGTAFYESMDRTEDLIESKLFRERLITSFMVRDLHVMDELKGFIELYNPEYWKGLGGQFDGNGNETIEFKIAQRVRDLRYPDGDNRTIYARLKGVLRLIEEDLARFDQIRSRPEFNDIEEIIAEGDYKKRLEEKRSLIRSIHQNRLRLLHDGFIKREKMELISPHYTRQQRSNAITAGSVGDSNVVSAIFDPALGEDEQTFADDYQAIIDHSIPLLDLAGNA